jgi:4-hydroxy-tetrahydrodipicolinate synthase
MIEPIASSGMVGVAVGAWVGRGPRLNPDDRADLIAIWREGLRPGQWLVVGVGAPPEVRRPTEVIETALASARQARELGADALLIDPPGAIRGRPDRDRLVLEYHAELTALGLPSLVSYRRESSGGIAYGPDVLAQLLARPEVLGVEVSSGDGITAFQQVEALARELAPGKLVISGEDRFLGYSLMCGADAALVGVGFAHPGLVLDLLDAHTTADAHRFLERSARVDRLARAIFAPPVEGIPLRLLWTLVQGGTLPIEAAHDPWGPAASRLTLERFAASLRQADPNGTWLGA